MKKNNSALVITVFGFGLMASFFPVTNAFAGDETRLRLECRAFGPGDTKVDARYGKRGTRERLRTGFEAAPGGLFEAGNVLDVTVNGLSVGSMILDQPGGIGDIVGDLDFDSTANADDEDLPFPAIAIGDGDVVMVGELGCALAD